MRAGKLIPTTLFYLAAPALAVALLALSPIPAEAGCSKSVTLYNASWCHYCKQVRAILARNHIKYKLLDATTAPVQAVMLRKFGDTAVPRTVIGGVVVTGVDEARMKQLCRADSESPPGGNVRAQAPDRSPYFSSLQPLPREEVGARRATGKAS